MKTTKTLVVTGNATRTLAENVTKIMGTELGKLRVEHFQDGEVDVEFLEHIRGRELFIIQSTCAPCNTNLMELMLIADAALRASVSQITAVIPYFGYARQDRRVRSARVPISARVIADMLTQVGVKRVLTLDLHAEQIQGFFHIPVDNIYASSNLLQAVYSKEAAMNDVVIVSPDIGGVVRARAAAKSVNCDLAIIDKRRDARNKSEVMHIIGDVEGRNCIIVDDLVDTAGTLCNAAAALKRNGARRVTACAVHPVLSGDAITNINKPALDSLVVCDTIALSPAARRCEKISSCSVATLLAEAINSVVGSESISQLFLDPKKPLPYG